MCFAVKSSMGWIGRRAIIATKMNGIQKSFSAFIFPSLKNN